MPFALSIVGLILLVSAVRGTQDELFELLRGDFTGEGNFVYWVLSLLAIGAVGYIPRMKPISDAFLVLVILVLILSRGNPNSATGGLFEKLTEALATTTTDTDNTQPDAGSVPALPSLPNL